MVLFRCSYLVHRYPWKLNMARFEERPFERPFNWYIETWVSKKVFHFSVRKFFGTCLKLIICRAVDRMEGFSKNCTAPSYFVYSETHNLALLDPGKNYRLFPLSTALNI